MCVRVLRSWNCQSRYVIKQVMGVVDKEEGMTEHQMSTELVGILKMKISTCNIETEVLTDLLSS
jgi:hypothetical protein